MKDMIIIGAGDFGREVAWLIEDINKRQMTYRVLGYLDDANCVQGQTVHNYKVLGKIEFLKSLCDNNEVCCVIAMQDTIARKLIVERLDWFSKCYHFR